jgi:hypothetical protein
VVLSEGVLRDYFLHKRSKEKLQLRQMRAIVFSKSFHDNVRCETVCTVNRADVITLLNQPVQMSLVPDVEKGDVLVDSRGRGSFQRLSEDG